MDIRCKRLDNLKKGCIINSIGTILIESELNNQGHMRVEKLAVEFGDTTKKGFFMNDGEVACRKLKLDCAHIRNRGVLFGFDLEIRGTR